MSSNDQNKQSISPISYYKLICYIAALKVLKLYIGDEATEVSENTSGRLHVTQWERDKAAASIYKSAKWRS